MLIELAHHDMGALHQPHLGARVDPGARRQHLLDPGAAGIDQRTGVDGGPGAAVAVLDRDLPDAVGLSDFHRAGAGVDFGAAIGGIPRRQYD